MEKFDSADCLEVNIESHVSHHLPWQVLQNLSLVKTLLSVPGELAPGLHSLHRLRGNLHPDHVLADVVKYLHVLVLSPGGLSDDLLHLTNQHGEHEHAGQPSEQHEHDLLVILGVHLRVLPDGDGGLGGEEEALDVGVPDAVVDELVAPYPLGGGEHVVGTGQEMHEDDHDVDRLNHPYDGRDLGGGVPPVEGSGEGVLSEDAVEAEERSAARDAQEDVEDLAGEDTQQVNSEVTVLHVVPGAQLPVSFVDTSGPEVHDPGLDQQDVEQVDRVTDIVAEQPVEIIVLIQFSVKRNYQEKRL